MKIFPENLSRTFYTVLFCLSGILGGLLVFYAAHNYGAGLSSDSVGYIGTARNIIAGKGIVTYTGNPLIKQPPLYPLVLAFIGFITKLDPVIISIYVNIVGVGVTIFFVGQLLYDLFPTKPILLFIALAITFASPVLLSVSTIAWSETLFILLVTLSFFFMNQYIQKNDLKSLFFLSLSIALSPLTRYIGVILILWAGIILIFINRKNLQNRILHFLLFVCISTIPIGLWVGRNYILSNSFLGPRSPSGYTLTQNLYFVYKELLNWFIPNRISNSNLLLLLLGLIFFAYIAIYFKKIRTMAKQNSIRVFPILSYILLYTAFLVISSTTTAYDQIGTRLLSPIYIPCVFLLFLFIEMIMQIYQGNKYEHKILLAMYFCILIWAIGYPIRYTFINANSMAITGYGYSGKSWRENQTMQYILENPSLQNECTIYTNAPDALYVLADIDAKWTPAKTYYNSPTSMNNPGYPDNDWYAKDSQSCLLWITLMKRDFLFTLDEIKAVTAMEAIEVFDDGSIYYLPLK